MFTRGDTLIIPSVQSIRPCGDKTYFTDNDGTKFQVDTRDVLRIYECIRHDVGEEKWDLFVQNIMHPYERR